MRSGLPRVLHHFCASTSVKEWALFSTTEGKWMAALFSCLACQSTCGGGTMTSCVFCCWLKTACRWCCSSVRPQWPSLLTVYAPCKYVRKHTFCRPWDHLSPETKTLVTVLTQRPTCFPYAGYCFYSVYAQQEKAIICNLLLPLEEY